MVSFMQETSFQNPTLSILLGSKLAYIEILQEKQMQKIFKSKASFPLILGVKSEDNVEEEAVEHAPREQYADINPYTLNVINIHSEKHIFSNQYELLVIAPAVDPLSYVVELADPYLSEGAGLELVPEAMVAPVALELVDQKRLERVLDRGDVVQPFPVDGDLGRFQEEAAGEEEESCGGYDHCVSGDVARNDSTNQHHVGVCGDERGVEDQPELDDAAVEAEDVFGDGCEGEALDGEEWEVDDEGGDDVGGGAVGIVGGLPDEDEPLLDEGWDGVVGGEEDKADGEDVEVEDAVDA